MSFRYVHGWRLQVFQDIQGLFRKNISAASTVVYGAIVSCGVSDEPVLIVEAVGE